MSVDKFFHCIEFKLTYIGKYYFVNLFMDYIFLIQGTLKEKLESGMNPTTEWGPQKKEDRAAWERFVKNRRLSDHSYLNGVKVTNC